MKLENKIKQYYVMPKEVYDYVIQHLSALKLDLDWMAHLSRNEEPVINYEQLWYQLSNDLKDVLHSFYKYENYWSDLVKEWKL